MSAPAATSISSLTLTLADLHRLFIAECCAKGETNIAGLYDAHDAYKKTPGKARASLYDFMTTQYSAIAHKYNQLNPKLKLTVNSMQYYMCEMKKKEEQQRSVPPRVQARMTGGADEVSVVTFATDLTRNGIEAMDVDSTKSGCSGINSLVRGVGNMGFLEDKSMDGDRSMHTAHSRRHFMPLVNLAQPCSTIDEFAADDIASHFINKVAQLWNQEKALAKIDDLIKLMTTEERLSCGEKLHGFIQACQMTLENLQKAGATTGEEKAD